MLKDVIGVDYIEAFGVQRRLLECSGMNGDAEAAAALVGCPDRGFYANSVPALQSCESDEETDSTSQIE